MGNICCAAKDTNKDGREGLKLSEPVTHAHNITDQDVWKQVDDLWEKNGLDKLQSLD